LNATYAGTFINPIRIASATGAGTNFRNILYNTVRSELVYSSSVDTSGAKTFVIDHPIDPERYLVHACLEGPEVGVYYRGKSIIETEIEISLPDYTCRFYDFTVHVTPVGQFAELYASEVENGKFKVYNNNFNNFKRPVNFNWVVYAKRAVIDVEPLKNNIFVKGNGPYRWI